MMIYLYLSEFSKLTLCRLELAREQKIQRADHGDLPNHAVGANHVSLPAGGLGRRPMNPLVLQISGKFPLFTNRFAYDVMFFHFVNFSFGNYEKFWSALPSGGVFVAFCWARHGLSKMLP